MELTFGAESAELRLNPQAQLMSAASLLNRLDLLYLINNV